MRRRQAIDAMLRRYRQAFRTHDLDVGDAEEAEQEAQVRLLEIRATVQVEAAPAAGEDQLLAASQPLRPGSV